ncbi:MAG: pantetheine-phosphate adenylyltransferase [Clostridiales bacterium]|nr:pantetheine-phosphate adenylyltransferase [Clostridiales bacterium]
MKTGIYPGSFDPITLGHLDIIKRAALVVDKLIIGVLNNSAKKSLFTPEERVAMIQKVTSDIPNVEVESFNGLLVDFADQKQAHIIVRGLRAISDFEYELQIAQTNRKVNSKVDTMFFTTSEEYSYISSSIVKEYAMYGGDVSQFVTPYVETCLKAKIKENR